MDNDSDVHYEFMVRGGCVEMANHVIKKTERWNSKNY